jgi:hypothetical protein
VSDERPELRGHTCASCDGDAFAAIDGWSDDNGVYHVTGLRCVSCGAEYCLPKNAFMEISRSD